MARLNGPPRDRANTQREEMTKINGIETIRTRADGTWLFVKVLTDQPGLYGIGSA